MNYLLEVKDGSKPASACKLTPHEVKWIAEWMGCVAIVYDIDDALKAIGINTKVTKCPKLF